MRNTDMHRPGHAQPAGVTQRSQMLANGLLPGVLLALTAGLLALNLVGRAHPAPAQPAPANAGTSRDITAGTETPQDAYFMFHYPPYPETFIFKLTDPVKIQAARDMLSGQRPHLHILGTIVKTPADYNRPWSYHLDPASVDFFTNAIEACDATIQNVEANLDQVCDSFLPGCTWCPWGSRLIAEVQIAPTPTPGPFLPIVMKDGA